MSYFISASLFPSPITPSVGLFVRHRLTALQEHLSLDKHHFFIASPTPYFPFKHPCFKQYAHYAQKPTGTITMQNLQICYPRYLQIPLCNSHFSGYLTYLSLKKHFNNYVKSNGKPLKLIAEYGFPDAIAIYHLSKRHNIPYIVTLRGSDMSYFMRLKNLKPQIMQALEAAETIICVSQNMKQALHETHEIPLEKISVIGNGVNKDIFYATYNASIRDQYALKTPYLISSVGGLIDRKNHSLAIKAIQSLPNHSLVIAGEGPQRPALEQLIKSLNLQDRVFLIGTQTQTQLADLYNASDLFLLCSLSEGRPNVVLEAIACGTTVLTTNVHGVDEIITHPCYGTIIDKSTAPQALADKITSMMHYPYDKNMIQNHGHSFSWEKSAALYAKIITH
ncbi:MAG: glycosyltransferase involved in cell wall biosynthesis [Alphaproteobacteria bacterium]|jgi:glycosyltransferase involved in cell wall biosynthesis